MEQAASFILAGGQSSRMGTDKALLPSEGEPVLLRLARMLGELTKEVHVIAPRERYAHLGLPVTSDLRPGGAGPLAGIETALALERAEWNLIVACDMPNLRPDILRQLLRQIFTCNSDCILTLNPEGFAEPLCSLYRRSSLPGIRKALDAGVRKITDALRDLQVTHFTMDNQEVLENLNTPEDLRRHLEHRRG